MRKNDRTGEDGCSGKNAMNDIRDNLKRVYEKVGDAAIRAGRSPEDVTLVAVTKTVPASRINLAIDAGVKIIGENRVQEAEAKKEEVQPVTWHMVGHLQTNKVKKVVPIFDMIHSVDSWHLAREIDEKCRNIGKIMPVLVEVNTSGEESKFGMAPEAAIELVEKMSRLPNISIRGLMTIGLFSDDRRLVTACFRKLCVLAEKIKSAKLDNVRMEVLSMGMSSDYELAISEGSTMVRIGTAIFGSRN